MNGDGDLREIEIVYGASDFRALYRACRSCKRNAAVLLIVAPAILGYLSYDGAQALDLLFAVVPYFLIVLIVVIGVYFLAPLSVVRARRKNGWAEPMSVSLTDEGISIRHPTQTSLFYWSKIRDVVRRGPRTFLFTTPSCAIILPRRCFANDEQFSSWTERARRDWQQAIVTVE